MLKYIMSFIAGLFFYFYVYSAYPFSVMIDVGHWAEHGGAKSALGIPEVEYNKRVALRIQKKLQAWGVDTLLSENLSLQNRVIYANNYANIFISIHHDGMDRRISYRFYGFGLFISNLNSKYKKSLKLAKYIGEELVKNDFVPALYHAGNKRRHYKLIDKEKAIYKTKSLVVIRDTKIPAVLIEVGVISNIGEEQFLNLEETQNKLTTAISEGIKKFIQYE